MHALWQALLPKAERKPNRSQAQIEKEITFNLLIQYNRRIMYFIHNTIYTGWISSAHTVYFYLIFIVNIMKCKREWEKVQDKMKE